MDGVLLSEAEAEWKTMLMGLDIRDQDRARVDDIQARPPISAESCGTAQDELDLRTAFGAESDGEVERILDARPQTPETWFTRKKYEAQRSNHLCAFPTTPPVELSDRDLARYNWLRGLGAWARGDRAKATRILAALPPKTRSSNAVVVARTLLRDGMDLQDLYFDAPTDPALKYMEMFRRTGHPLFGYLRGQQLRGAQRWGSLSSVMKEVNMARLEFPDDEPGTILLGATDMRGRAAFFRREWAAAAAAFSEFKRRAPTQGRIAYADTWLRRIAYFKTHEDRLNADLPRL
jgi:hypothetical protein